MLTFLIIIYMLVGLGMGAKYYEEGENKYLCFMASFIWPCAVGYTLATKAG